MREISERLRDIFDIDPDALWSAVSQEIQSLKQSIDIILGELDE